LLMDVQPDVISAVLTTQLMVNCSITNNHVAELDVIKYLTLLSYSESIKSFEDLLTLEANTFNLQKIRQFKHSQIKSGNLFITLTLQDATQFDAKVYRCNVTGDAYNATTISFVSKKEVKYETLSTTLLEQVRRSKKDIDRDQSPCKKEELTVHQKQRNTEDKDKTYSVKRISPKSCHDVNSTYDRVVVTLDCGLKVMCDTKADGGGWIVIQRRVNGKIHFLRGWSDYRNGFGDYKIGEFYLGNENIFMLTSCGQYVLRIDLKYNNQSYYAQYTDFQISSESENYKLNIKAIQGMQVIVYRVIKAHLFSLLIESTTVVPITGLQRT
ncbi:BpFREP20.2, partial [Biomphalaria pfeifferi]